MLMKRFLAGLLLLASLPTWVLASGRIEVAGNTGERRTLAMTRHEVKVEIDNQVSVTRVIQEFKNDGTAPVSGSYLFKKPRGAEMFRFVTWIDGKPREGKIFEKVEARVRYERAQAAGQQAALAEQRGEDVFSVSLSSIPAGATQRIELAYIQVLAYDNGSVQYRYPLTGDMVTPGAVAAFDFALALRSRVPLATVHASAEPLAIARQELEATATLTATDKAFTKDIELGYVLSRKTTGIDLVTSKKAGEDGYFLLLVTPHDSIAPAEIQGKDMTFVVDVSGSMRGVKIEQAKNALLYCLRSLKTKDRFNIVLFSSSATTYAPAMLDASAENVRAAEEFAKRIVANGGTNIDEGMSKAIEVAPKDAARPHIIAYLTDGRPSAGVVDRTQIIARAKDRLPAHARVYTFGIGHDLDEVLLRRLADQTRGTSAFVRGDAELELAISNFQKAISHPVLSDLALDFGGAGTSKLFPRHVNYLFAGQQLMIIGRYTTPGEHEVKLTARAHDGAKTIQSTFAFAGDSEADSVLPRLYALSRIKQLTDEIALENAGSDELVKEVVRLSKTSNIATAYTSFLVVDEKQAEEAPVADHAEEAEKAKESLKKDASAAGGALRRMAQDKGGASGAPPQDRAPAPGGAPTQDPAATGAPPPANQPAAPAKAGREGMDGRRAEHGGASGEKAMDGKADLERARTDGAARPSESQSRHAMHAALAAIDPAKLPGHQTARMRAAYALAQAGTTRTAGDGHLALATLCTELMDSLALDMTRGGDLQQQAMSLAILARLFETEKVAADGAFAQKLIAGLEQADPAAFSPEALVWTALGLDRARRAGLAVDAAFAAKLLARAAGEGAGLAAARRLLGQAVPAEGRATLVDAADAFAAAIALAGTAEGQALSARLAPLYADPARALDAALADGALVAQQ